MNVRDIEITAREVANELKSSEIALIDCREVSEYEIARIDGAALFPMSEIGDRLDDLRQYQGKRVVVYCHHGGRSFRVANWLRMNGHPSAQSMAGGIDTWSLEIDTGVPRY